MCGIAGAIGYMGATVVDAVERMSAGLAHRGPDGAGLWSSQPDGAGTGVVLAHRRLAIIDLSDAGRQPMADPETGNVIVFNGEIYNYRELREELRAAGEHFQTHSDTEVLLVAYRRWGDAFLSRLRGIFAFVLWSSRERRALVVRDQLGIKPLYWAVVGTGERRTLLFASEVRALLDSAKLGRELDAGGLGRYLWNGFLPGPGTIVAGVGLYPAASRAWVDPAAPGIHPVPYWRIPAAAASPRRDVEELRTTLREAVGMQLVSDVPLGVFLSGGVDSSAVAALAVRSGRAAGRIRTFAIGFDEALYDESRYARAVAASLGTEHTEIRLDEATFRRGLAGALAGIDQPTFDAINTYFVSRAVREAGMTVALAGTGGDEIFGGYRSYRDLPVAARVGGALRWMPESWLRAGAAGFIRMHFGKGGPIPPQTRWGKLGDALAARDDLAALYQVSYGLFTQDFLAQLQVGGVGGQPFGIEAGRLAQLRALVQGEPRRHGIAMLELSLFLGERLLRDTDAASMAVALEARVPLLDHKVIEAAAALDDRTRFHPPGRKQLLRDLALDGLDPAIFDRPKSGFVLPLDRWCRSELRGEMDDVFNDASLCAAAGVSQDAVLRLWKAFTADMPGLYWSRVWAVFVLLWWCRRHRLSLH